MNYSTQIKNILKYDFVVCGGGMTGAACAIAAARKGIKTLLIERNGSLGGVGTSGGVNHLLGGLKYKENLGKTLWNVKGIFEEISLELMANGDAVNPDLIDRNHNPHGWTPTLADGVIFNSLSMEMLLDDKCKASGVDILYFTDIIDVLCENGKIKGVVIHNKSGIAFVEGECFADTTGDADIAAACNAPTVTGRPEDNGMGPSSVEFHVRNVDTAELSDYIQNTGEVRFKKLIKELRNQGIWDFPYEIFISVQLTEEDVYMINTVRQVGVDGTNALSLTNAIIDGRREIHKLFGIMKNHFPGFKDAYIDYVAPVVGIRETRRIIGEFVLTVDDLISQKTFDDSIAVSSYNWDLPDPQHPSYQPMDENPDNHVECTHIPYRCLLPQGVDNLIVAGRCISVERDVLGPVRVMAPCMAMGQAAGTAAYFAKNAGGSFKAVDVSMLKKVLAEDNCICDMK